MSYLQTSTIEVFPSVKRGKNQVSARLMSEQAISGIVNNLIDTDGFIITRNITSDGPFEFNIHGYYFKIDHINNLTNQFSTATSIYGIIQIKEEGNYELLQGQDDEGEYRGIEFNSSSGPTETPETGTKVYSLLLLSRTSTSGTWGIDKGSRYKFNYSFEVDGGEF